MNARQRTRVILLGGLVGSLAVFFIFYRVFWVPYQDQNTKLATLEKEHEDKDRELKTFLAEQRKLGHFKWLGLPANSHQSESEYYGFLKNLFNDTGLSIKNLPGGTITENKPFSPGSQQGAKKAGHTLITYQASVAGEWANLLAFLEKFQRTPLLHRIKSFTLDRSGPSSETEKNPKLGITLTIEAMIVHKSEQRPNNLWGVNAPAIALDTLAALSQGPTGWSALLRAQALLVPEMPARTYADLSRKNIFVGALPPPPLPPPVAKKPPPPPPEVDVRQYVQLVMTNESEQKATLRNMLINLSEKRRAFTTLSPKFPFNTFQVLDEEQEEVLVRGKVLRIDHRDVYFQVGEAIYAIHMGQNLADAMKTPLSPKDQETLGLTKK